MLDGLCFCKDDTNKQDATCCQQPSPHGVFAAAVYLACDIPCPHQLHPPPILSLPCHIPPTSPTLYLHQILSLSLFHSLMQDHWLPCSRCRTSLDHSGSIGNLSLKRSLQESIPRDMHSRWRSLSEQDLKAILLGRFVSEFFCIASVCSVLCCSLWDYCALLCSILPNVGIEMLMTATQQV